MGDKNKPTKEPEAEVVAVATVEPEAQAVATTTDQHPGSVDTFISQAIQAGAPIETMERLFKLSEDMKAAKAKESFTRAMASLQGQLPIVKKLKSNGGTNSMYAPLEDIIDQCKGHISENGFMYSWDTQTTENKITVTCFVTHEEGHVAESKMVSDVSEGTRANSAPQKAAITITYLKRYTFCNAFGIAVADEDQDARLGKEEKKPAPADPKAQIVAMLQKLGVQSQSAEETKTKIMDLTQLDATEANYPEIISRLSILIEEKGE